MEWLKKVLEIGGGDGGKTMYLMPLNCTLKNYSNGKFDNIHVLPQKKSWENSAPHLHLHDLSLHEP